MTASDPNLANVIGRLANLENAAANADILRKRALDGVQALGPRLTSIERRLGESHIGDISLRLAALEAAALANPRSYDAAPRPPVFKLGFDRWKELLSGRYPELYPHWLKLYEHALPHYNTSVEASCSTWNNRFAVAFRDYVKIFGRGYLLDVGSGTLNIPVYLAGYPLSFTRGLDPRPPETHTELHISCGVNEFIPYADESFQTVCNATSLDHVIDLDRSLSETARVLSSDGLFVIWYAHLPGSPPPPSVTDSSASGVDDFHLFHINDEWFMPTLDRYFHVVDRRVYPVGSFCHVFAAYRKR